MAGMEIRAEAQTAKADGSSAVERQLPYAAGLDGLRALAVLAVVLYHAGQGWLQGGFFGVEVFFVISGYLITSLLLGEWDRQGRIDLKAFWLRRARRLLPALFTMLLAVLTYAVVFLPGEVAGMRKDVLAATFYVTNWYLIFDHKSYFEAVGRPPVLQHLWSLAIEEQFYLLWPVFVFFALRRWSRRIVLAVVLVVATASAVLMGLWYVPDIDPSRIYYGTDTRASGLLVGVALALVWRPWLRQGQAGRITSAALDALGLAAVAGIVAFCLCLGEYDPFVYQGGFALLALTTAAAIAAVVHPASHLSSWFLGRQPLRWIGLRSYSIYLWHWPVFMLSRPQLDVPLEGWPLLALHLAAIGILAELSYRLVETPIRGGALGRTWKSLQQAHGARRRQLGLRWGGAVGTLATCLLALGVATGAAQPPPQPSYLPASVINTVGQAAAQERLSPANGGATAGVSVRAPSDSNHEAKTEPTLGEPATPAPKLSVGAVTAAGSTPVDLDALGSDRRQPSPHATAAGTQTPSAAKAADASPQAAIQSQPTPVGATPTPRPPAHAARATVIGDSVVLSAWAAVHQVPGLEVDGEVGRQAAEAIAVLRKDSEEGFLASTVVVDIGNNGPFSERQFDQMMSVLGSQRRVIFMTVHVARDWEGPNNAVITEGVKRYPNAELIDWHAISANHPEWFRDDGLHTSEAGAKAYASLIAEAVSK